MKRCAWCESLGGNVTAGGNVAEWAASELVAALVRRLEEQSGGSAFLLAADSLRYIGLRLTPAHGDGDASTDLAGWLLGPADYSARAGREHARLDALVRSLLPLLPYPVLLDAVHDALTRCGCGGVK